MSSCLSDVDLVAGTTLDNVYHVVAYTGALRIDAKITLKSHDASLSLEALASTFSFCNAFLSL